MATSRMRIKKKTITTSEGIRVTTTTFTKAPVLEWCLQAAQVRALRSMPEYGVRFAIAGDFNAGRRSPQQSIQAKATGLTSGEHDLRIYLEGGRLGLIENKGEKGRLSPEQKDRHALLGRLGFNLQAVVKASTEEEAANAGVALVRKWLAANDNVLAAREKQA